MVFNKINCLYNVVLLSVDALNRLISASGKAKDASYTLDMAYNVMSMPVSKAQTVENSSKAASYTNMYKYEDADHPTAPSQIGHEHYTYDANGNPVRVENDSTDATRELYWDEDNRLMVLSDNGKTSRYTYNHAGERVVKSHGSMEGVYINGAPQGITFHETDEYTLYPASILSVTKNRFTKHYFIGSKRVASRIGSGSFNNMYGVNGSYVTAGQQDYAERLSQIESQKEDYYKKLGIAPGIPTMKGSYADPENTGIGYNTIIKELGDHSVPAEWAQYVKKNEQEGTAPGAPIAWDDPSDPDEAQPGYGFVADGSADSEETYFFHSDHLGSTSYITDNNGNITQYDAYLPFGELLVDEHSSSEEMPYKFNGKELDEETGLYYYGARYMQPMASVWYGVDPLAEKYSEISGYVYCHANPIKLIDPDGMDDNYNTKGKFIKRVNNGTNFVIVNKQKLFLKGKPVTTNEFKMMASTVYGESSVSFGITSKEEMFAIASVQINNRKAKAFGDKSPAAIKFRSRDLEKQDEGMQMANAAIINALTGGFDYSRGANQWDGAEQAMRPQKYANAASNGKFMYKINTMGWSMSDADYKSWKDAVNNKFGAGKFTVPQKKAATQNYKGMFNKGKIRLFSTAQYGLTIFWKER